MYFNWYVSDVIIIHKINWKNARECQLGLTLKLNVIRSNWNKYTPNDRKKDWKKLKQRIEIELRHSIQVKHTSICTWILHIFWNCTDWCPLRYLSTHCECSVLYYITLYFSSSFFFWIKLANWPINLLSICTPCFVVANGDPGVLLN